MILSLKNHILIRPIKSFTELNESYKNSVLVYYQPSNKVVSIRFFVNARWSVEKLNKVLRNSNLWIVEKKKDIQSKRFRQALCQK